MSPDTQPEWMVAADVVILADLAEQRLDYVPLVASRCGLHVSFAERRCRLLADNGYLERATSEVTFRMTRRGEQFLAAELESGAAEVESDASPRA